MPTASDIATDRFYTVESMPGIAWTVRGPATDDNEVWEPFCSHGEAGPHDDDCDGFWTIEQVPSETHVLAVMVGDDREHLIDASELKALDEDGFCHGCGQVGCGH